MAEPGDERNARFLRLLRPVHRDCERWAYTLAQNETDAKDVLAEAVLTALQSIHQLKNDDAFKTWFFQIIRSTWLQMLRRRRPVDSLEPADLERHGATVGEVRRRETAELVRAAVARLAPEQRQAIELFELQELSIKQVAQVMGKNENAVRVLLHRGRARLEKLLKEAGVGLEDAGGT